MKVKDESHSASFTANVSKAVDVLVEMGVVKKKWDKKLKDYTYSVTKEGKKFADSETFKTMLKESRESRGIKDE